MSTISQQLVELFRNFRTGDPAIWDALEALYASDVVFIDPLQRIDGRAAFRAMNERVFGRLRYARFEDVTAIGDEPRFALSWVMVFRAKLGGEMRAPGMSEIRTEGGKVVYHRDHWDVLSTMVSGFPSFEPIYKQFTALFG